MKKLRQRTPPLLVLALGGAAAALSWDALRAVAVQTGAVHHTVMAGVWAATIDLLWIACMRAAAKAKPGRRGWTLAGLVVGVCFSGFQMFTPWTWLARMVPVTALLVAWMLETYVVSKPVRPVHPGLDPAMEVTDDAQAGPYPRRDSTTRTDDRADGGRPALPVGVGVEGDAVVRGPTGVGRTGTAHRDSDRAGAGAAGGTTVTRAGPDGVAPDRTGSMSIGEAVRYLIDAHGVDPHEITPKRIVDEVRRLTGKPAVSTGAIGNALAEARKKATSNGGVRVR